MSDLDRNKGFILSDLARLMRVVFDRRIKGLGLTRSQWFLMAHLYRADGLTQTELADILELEKATVGKTIDRLEESGWIFRKRDPTDRRVNRIHLTDKFGPYVPKLQKSSHDLISEAFGHLDEKEFDQLVDSLRHARANLLELSTPE
ncbi:MarR family winged helix-turn-helix transcriptional regulator [Kordiimonas sp.]|uniref:MarR family winged helix-turn-helix transcriptional regulator n=1 Tax=Kordiimonas sp. TaxID=1970157 RepID=UPI003B52CFFA